MTKLSRSKIELFIECPRCFWLDIKKGIKRPQPAPYTINNAVDWLLKQEFDVHRKKGTPHPIMEKHKIDAVPFDTPDIDKWRHNFTGVGFYHEPTDFLVYGAIDDAWINSKGELHVVDYKATGANKHQIYDSYGRQMEIYQWLLRRNKHRVSPTGYFVFARVSKANGFGQGEAVLPFDIFVEKYNGNDDWVEKTIRGAREIFDIERAPRSTPTCEFCAYRRAEDSP